MRRLAIAAAFVLVGLANAQTPPVQPKIQEAPMPPPVALPPPTGEAGAIRTITADDVARIALRYQQSLRIAAANVLTANGRVREARAALNPSLTATGSYSRSQTFRSAAGTSSSTGGTTTSVPGYSSSVSVKQLIFDFNHTLDSVRQAASQETAARHDYTRAEADLVLSVKQAYYTFVQNSNLVKVGEANLTNRNSQLALARARFNAGVGQPADLVQAETNLGDAEQALVQARAAQTTSGVTLSQLMGIDPRTPLSPAESHEGAEPGQDMNSLVSLALQRRPEVLSAKANQRAAAFGLSAARTLTAPNLSLTLTASSRGPRDPFDSSSGLASLGISWPIFDGGAQSGKVQEAHAAIQSASATEINAEQQVVSDVSQAYVSLKSAEQRKAITTTQVANALEGVRIAQGRYQAGLGTFIDVTTAQALLVTAQTNDVNAQATVDVARASLAHAIGQPVLVAPIVR